VNVGGYGPARSRTGAGWPHKPLTPRGDFRSIRLAKEETPPMSDMTITAVRTTMLRVPWPQTPWLKGHAFGDARNFLVVDVETKGGITGMGYLFLFRPGIRSIIACLDEVIIPRVIGKDASAVEAIWQDLWKTTITFGRGGIATMAMSALDKALHYKERGYKAIKMQVAHVGSLATDLDNVKRMREAVGPDIDIMIDVNMGWTPDVAIQMGRKFQDYNVYWLEEPVVPDDFAGYLRIAQALDLRIVGGETHFTRFDLKPFFENPRLPILQPDPMRGGLTELRKIATVADTWGVTIAPHLFPELNVQLLASIPNGIWIEDMGLAEDLFVDPVPVVNGMITAPERPGHGLAFKPEILRDCVVK
jgi:L-alanine-DL-glutamate epimerase-like enolase superfamily enzyme